jgi:hypothetical protein
MRTRRFWKSVGALAALYALACGALLAIMCQPPERFASIVARIPGPALFLLLPFERLWLVARGGHLRVSDPAPDFDLSTLDRRSTVRISSFRGSKPVVLVFGSYT